MKILGITGPALHDNSAALIVDGKFVAAAEEERFIRVKHAKRKQPINALKYCLDYAGVSPSEIDIVAYPYVKIGLATISFNQKIHQPLTATQGYDAKTIHHFLIGVDSLGEF